MNDDEAREMADEIRRRVIAAGDEDAIRHLEELHALADDPEFWKQDFPTVREQWLAAGGSDE